MQNLKLIISATVAVGAIVGVGAASAADLAARPYTKAAPVIAAMYDWSGFYVGINGGGGSSHDCWSLTQLNSTFIFNPPLRDGCGNATGATVGGQVGYRWQANAWVFGVEAQGNWADFNGSRPSPLSGNFLNDESRTNAFGLFTGQVGYAVNNVLFYGKGGAAVVRNRYNKVFAVNLGQPIGTVLNDGRETRWGGVAGAGIEFGFAPNWSVAVEYDHIFMGTKNVAFNDDSRNNISQDIDIGTVRLNYRFGGPVVTRY